jgi:hypothetical protein
MNGRDWRFPTTTSTSRPTHSHMINDLSQDL